MANEDKTAAARLILETVSSNIVKIVWKKLFLFDYLYMYGNVAGISDVLEFRSRVLSREKSWVFVVSVSVSAQQSRLFHQITCLRWF